MFPTHHTIAPAPEMHIFKFHPKPTQEKTLLSLPSTSAVTNLWEPLLWSNLQEDKLYHIVGRAHGGSGKWITSNSLNVQVLLPIPRDAWGTMQFRRLNPGFTKTICSSKLNSHPIHIFNHCIYVHVYMYVCIYISKLCSVSKKIKEGPKW